MNYMKIKDCDIANGAGVRVSLFVSGCEKRCPGCFNEETWDPSAGEPFTGDTQEEIIQKVSAPYVTGLTLIGGEPLRPENYQTLLDLCKDVHSVIINGQHRDIWCYTGYTWEELVSKMGDRKTEEAQTLRELLIEIDVLVEGPFIQELADRSLRFRGSKNQSIILSTASVVTLNRVIWEECGRHDDPFSSNLRSERFDTE